MRKLVIVLLVLLLVMQIGAVGASAADYTFTVRIYAGNRGSINGSSVLVFDNLHYGDPVSFSLSSVGVNDARYYAQGIRRSGRDNDSALQPTTFFVTEDVDYVVAYGIEGNLVPYVVNYQTLDGVVLAEPQTYYGNVGEKPVIAFLYIDGFVPQAYNITKTLSANAAENVFTFFYSPLVVQQGAVGGGGGGDQEDDGGDGGDNAANAGNADDTVIIDEDGTPLDNNPLEIIDLDEDMTPTGNLVIPRDDVHGAESGARFAWSVVILFGSIAAFGAMMLFLFGFRRKKDDKEAEKEAVNT